jgi:hypothetical protein
MRHRESNRVPHILPEKWQEMSMDKRLEALMAEELRRDSVIELNHARAVRCGEALPHEQTVVLVTVSKLMCSSTFGYNKFSELYCQSTYACKDISDLCFTAGFEHAGGHTGHVRISRFGLVCIVASVSYIIAKPDKEVDELLVPITTLSRSVEERGDAMVVNLPEICTGWCDSRMVAIANKLKLQFVDVDCCALSVTADKGRHAGLPFKLVLRVAANIPQLHSVLELKSCVKANCQEYRVSEPSSCAIPVVLARRGNRSNIAAAAACVAENSTAEGRNSVPIPRGLCANAGGHYGGGWRLPSRCVEPEERPVSFRHKRPVSFRHTFVAHCVFQ